MIRPAVVLALGLLCAAPEGVRAACPANDLNLSSQQTSTTDATAVDTTFQSNHVAWNLAPGTLSLAYCCSLAPTYLNVGDAYDVTGVPAGTSVPLIVEVPLVGEVYDAGHCGGSGCGGMFRATIVHGTESAEFVHSVTLFDGNRSPFTGVVQLPVTIVAGQPEVVRFEFWARRSPGGSHGARGDGTIRFLGLPPGAAVVSCQGYSGSSTPARRASWGSLKSIYRSPR